MTLYDCKVVKETRMRSDPSINAPESYELLPVGATFTAVAVKVVKPGLEVWVQRDDGKWTAAIYPNTVTPPVGKVFVEYTEKPGTTPPPAPTVDIKIKRIVVDYVPVVNGVEQEARTETFEA